MFACHFGRYILFAGTVASCALSVIFGDSMQKEATLSILAVAMFIEIQAGTSFVVFMNLSFEAHFELVVYKGTLNGMIRTI